MSNGTVEQKAPNHSDVSLSDLKISNFASLNSFLIDELEVNLSINLSDDLKNIIKTYLSEYESLNQRKLEEKDSVICQLKQSLIDLTEKRYRASLQNGSNALPNENIEFLINEKEAKINQLLDQLSDNERDINKLKQTIKSQDDVILSLNNNIYELKNNNQTVLKAKQDSFKLMTEDLNNKQKLIDEQDQSIQELSQKVQRLEDELDKAHKTLEKRLNEKQTDLQIKIAQFEANLREGKIYFEDVLAEKTKEINRLKQKLESLGQSGDDEAQNSDEKKMPSINKLDSDNIQSIKALYEHQIDILKVKIEMLEKTCSNYQQGIKEMNKNFGIQQLSDEVNSIQTFKDLMQDLQKTNVNLETEKIDLQVNNSKLQSQLEQTRLEKENLNKKFQTVDQLNQRLSQEKLDLEAQFQSLLDLKEAHLAETNSKLSSLNTEYEQLRQDNIHLGQISLEYDQLRTTNQELTAHYEQLCQQATDIVQGNQMLNDQVESNNLEIESLKSQVNDLQLQIDHLTNCNSELNTQKVNFELKVEDLEEKIRVIEPDLDELKALRELKLDIETLNEKLSEMKIELEDKNELVEQLNQAKEFLAENNSKLLTNNIKIQLFVESLGLDQSEIENSQRVKEYDDLIEKLAKYEQEILGLRIKLEEMKVPEKQSQDKQTQFDNLSEEIDNLKERLASNENMTLKLKAKLKHMMKKNVKKIDNVVQTENGEYLNSLVDFGAEMAKKRIEEEVKDNLNELRKDVERLLLSRELKDDKSLNTSQDFDYRDQIVNLEAQLNNKLNEIGDQKRKIRDLEEEIKVKDEQIDALSDWSSTVPNKAETEIVESNDRESLDAQINDLTMEMDNLRKEKDVLESSVKNQVDLEAKIKQLEEEIKVKDEQIEIVYSEMTKIKDKLTDEINGYIDLKEQHLFRIGDLELAIIDLQNQVRVRDEQIETLSDLGHGVQNKSDNEDQFESLKHQVLDLQVEIKTKTEHVDLLESRLKTVDQEMESLLTNNRYLESELAKKNTPIEDIPIEKVQHLGNSDESIELKARISQIMIELSIKNEQLTSLENSFNEQKLSNEKMTEKLTTESENWKKKYETMRLKALALKDKCKKLEYGQNMDDGGASPSNSSKSSMDSSSLAEHLFLNLQAEYKDFKKTHEDQVKDLNALLISAQNEFNEYRLNYNEDKINDVHRMYTDQLKQYELNFESIQAENDELKGFKQKFDELGEKFSQMEKQNLKLKAKLKQVLTKSKEGTPEMQKMSTDKEIQTNLEDSLEQKVPSQVDLVHAQSQTQAFELASAQCQTEDNELESLRLQNEQLKCLIDELEKNKLNEEIKLELDELKEKIKQSQEQNLKLKAKLKQVMSSQKMSKVDCECQTEMETFVQKEDEMANYLEKISNLEELLGHKEKMNQDLRAEIVGLKEWIEKQRSDYENHINGLNAELVTKESNLAEIKEELSGLRSQSEVSMCSAMPLMSESLVIDETASTSSSNLENQLKFCHEKCEKVVAKLSLLRKQNESLNSKIRTIKSMIVS